MPLLVGAGIALGVVGARWGYSAFKAFQATPKTVSIRPFYKGGFEDKMSKREAALILGIRYTPARARAHAGHTTQGVDRSSAHTSDCHPHAPTPSAWSGVRLAQRNSQQGQSEGGAPPHHDLQPS